MSTKYNASMFDAIKSSLEKKPEGSGGLFREQLKFEQGNTYLVRLLPRIDDLKNSIFHYYNHGWQSVTTGQFVTAVCPTTFGEECPIDRYYLNTYRTGTTAEKEASKVLSRKEAWLVNVYVISDPTTPENEGQVKILRYGRELNKIIESAISGDDAAEFGPKVFDLLTGCTLRIKCESKSLKPGAKKGSKAPPTYVSSKFLAPAPLEGLSEDDAEGIMESTHDLLQVNRVPTPAEMQKMLDQHYFGITTTSVDDGDSGEEEEPQQPVKKLKAEPTETPLDDTPPQTESADVTEPAPYAAPELAPDDDTEAQLRKLLEDLG